MIATLTQIVKFSFLFPETICKSFTVSLSTYIYLLYILSSGSLSSSLLLFVFNFLPRTIVWLHLQLVSHIDFLF